MASVAVVGPSLDLGSRRQRFVRLPVTHEAVSHAQGHVLVDDLHVLDLAMASLTEDSRAHMRPVIEENVVRKLIDLFPFQWFARGVDRCELLYIRTVRLGHLVAIHAGGYGRYQREARSQGA